jgi:transposase-like protein
MQYTSRFSSNLTYQKLRAIFLGAKFDKKHPKCLKCNSDRIYKFDEEKFRCRRCRYFFRIQTNSFLNKKRFPLRLWYEIIYGFAICLPANKLKNVLVVNDYKTIYGAYKLIRQALVKYSEQQSHIFSGITEVDESYFGGKFKNLRKKDRARLRKLGLAKRGRGAKYRQQPVFGIFKRNGKVYLQLISEATKKILEKIITKRISNKGKIFSDTHTGYDGLVGLGYIHRTVNHGVEEYTKGKVHINGIEGFWGLTKTNMQSYKGIQKKNWNEYLKEMEFRYNYRNLSYDDLTILLIKIMLKNGGNSG